MKKQSMDRTLKIMVSSSVYGFENELDQIISTLQSFGYYVMNSHAATIRVNPRLSNLNNCLKAVEECDLFLGIIRPFMGTGNIRGRNITFEEIKKAIELNKPYWFLVHRDVVFANKLFEKIQDGRNILENNSGRLKRNRLFDPICIDVYQYVIREHVPLSNRIGNWAQEFYRVADMLAFITTQFKDMTCIRKDVLEQED